MISIPSATEVLIVGAGPTGLALAAELWRLGVKPVTIDKLVEGANTSRAAVVHARTLEVLEALDVVPQLLNDGLKVPTFRVRDRDKILISVDFKEIPSKYAFTLMCPQNRTEAILLARLRALGGAVMHSAEVTDMEMTGDGAHVSVYENGWTQHIDARWVIGCDGMHSRVREIAGLTFKGAAYAQSFVLADVRMDWPLERDEVKLFFSSDGLLVVAPLPENHYRIVATVDDAPEQPSESYVQALLDTRGPKTMPARIYTSVWSSRFKVHHRVAEAPRKGRVLLCGDAAHVHSPAGGQGMNTGIQDAVALAAVLVKVLAGDDETRLDSWAAERHQIAEHIVALTDRATKMATLHSPAGKSLRNVALGFAGHIEPFKRALARNIAELEDR